jgi:transposase
MDILRWIVGTKAGIKKRFWSDEEKRSICLQARAPCVSVAQVARRYAMNANLIFAWLRDPRFAPGSDAPVEGDALEASFFPVEVAGMEPVMAAPISRTSSTVPITAQRVDITLSDGRRILVEGATALPAIVALVEGLAQ